MKKNLPALFFVCILVLFTSVFPQVNTEKYRIAPDRAGFTVRSDLNFTLMMGNSDFQLAGTNTRFNYSWGKDYTFLVANGGYGRTSGKSFFSQTLLHLRNVNALNNFIQLEEFLQYDTNGKRLLLQRMLAGGGFRFKVISRENLSLRVGTAVLYEQEKYDLTGAAVHEANISALRSSSYLTLNFELKKDISLLSTTYVQPDVADIDDFKILADTALNIKLGEIVSLVLTANIRYDSRPPDTIEKLDLVSKVGVGIQY